MKLPRYYVSILLAYIFLRDYPMIYPFIPLNFIGFCVSPVIIYDQGTNNNGSNNLNDDFSSLSSVHYMKL